MEIIDIVKELEGMPVGRPRFIEAARLRIRNARILAENEEAARAEARRLYGDARKRFAVMRDARALLACAEAHGADERRPYWFHHDGFGHVLMMAPDHRGGMCIATFPKWKRRRLSGFGRWVRAHG